MELDEQKATELAERKAARPDVDWDGIEIWLERSASLVRPGGVVGCLLPDGNPFSFRKPGGPS